MKKHFFCFIILLLLFACKKNSIAPVIYTPVDTNLQKYFYYKPGTYWIYKDSISGQVDSFVTASDSISTVSIENSKIYTPYKIIIINVCAYKISNGLISFDGNWNWQLLDTRVYLNILSVPSDYSAPFFSYPIKNDSIYSQGEYGNFIVTTNMFSSFSIGGTNYNNVAEIHHFWAGFGVRPHNDWFSINNDAGIIKMRINNSPDSIYHVWELQKYNMAR